MRKYVVLFLAFVTMTIGSFMLVSCNWDGIEESLEKDDFTVTYSVTQGDLPDAEYTSLENTVKQYDKEYKQVPDISAIALFGSDNSDVDDTIESLVKAYKAMGYNSFAVVATLKNSKGETIGTPWTWYASNYTNTTSETKYTITYTVMQGTLTDAEYNTLLSEVQKYSTSFNEATADKATDLFQADVVIATFSVPDYIRALNKKGYSGFAVVATMTDDSGATIKTFSWTSDTYK